MAESSIPEVVGHRLQYRRAMSSEMSVQKKRRNDLCTVLQSLYPSDSRANNVVSRPHCIFASRSLTNVPGQIDSHSSTSVYRPSGASCGLSLSGLLFRLSLSDLGCTKRFRSSSCNLRLRARAKSSTALQLRRSRCQYIIPPIQMFSSILVVIGFGIYRPS